MGLGATGIGCFLDDFALRHFFFFDATPHQIPQNHDGGQSHSCSHSHRRTDGDKAKEKECREEEEEEEEDDDDDDEEIDDEGEGWADLYHFTVGVKAEDDRYCAYEYEGGMFDNIHTC